MFNRGNYRSRGFTIVELMVVVAIVGIMGYAMSSFDFEQKNDLEKRDRMVSKTMGVLRNIRTVAATGKTDVASGGCSDQVVTVTLTGIVSRMVDLNSTGSLVTTCSENSDARFVAPFFGETKYKINEVTGYDLGGAIRFSFTNTGTSIPVGTTAVQFVFDGINMRAYPRTVPAIVWPYPSNASEATIVKINAGYESVPGVKNPKTSKDIFLDLRTGSSNVKDPS